MLFFGFHVSCSITFSRQLCNVSFENVYPTVAVKPVPSSRGYKALPTRFVAGQAAWFLSRALLVLDVGDELLHAGVPATCAVVDSVGTVRARRASS